MNNLQQERVLITGGNGFIGSHTALALHQQGATFAIFDNLSNSTKAYLERVMTFTKPAAVYEGDCLDLAAFTAAVRDFQPTTVMHFAALKSVPNSMQNPLSYYEHNLQGLLNILRVMKTENIDTIVFSSSAAVYGTPIHLPITEDANFAPTSVYGQTKAMGEQIIKDFVQNEQKSAIALRYFNPIGAASDCSLGEVAKNAGNVAPLIVQAILNDTPFTLTGVDFDTTDGTGERDYIHVMDLAQAHIQALLYAQKNKGFEAFNIGTGHPYSVRQLIEGFEQASGKKVVVTATEKRPGDVAQCWADPKKANTILDWQASRALDVMCADYWRWAMKNHRP